jgi:hypothetical protein
MPSLGANLPGLLAMPLSGRCFRALQSPSLGSDAASKIAKSVHLGRYSAGLFVGPAPTSTGATIPNSANSPYPAWSMRMVPATMFLFGLLSIT